VPSPILIRPARAEDEPFVLATARRLSAFDVPRWRTPDEIVAGEARTLAAHFGTPAEGTRLLVAVDQDGRGLGFVFLETVRDYFSRQPHGHVGILAVTEESEGRGVGRALMDAAESWATERGFECLTLNVFEENRRARAVYEHLGYRPETIRYVKSL
jgi:GNAT superfamily N-acetyltransferase